MAVDEHSRHALHTKLEQVLGQEEAVTLMELVPPVGWGDVATKRDLDELRVASKHDLDEFRIATKRDIGELRADLDEFKTWTKHEFGELRTDFRDFRVQMDSHFRTTLFSVLTLMIGLAGLVFIAARLG